jgi:hypothetical protein
MDEFGLFLHYLSVGNVEVRDEEQSGVWDLKLTVNTRKFLFERFEVSHVW